MGMIPMGGSSWRVPAGEWIGCQGGWAWGLDSLHLVVEVWRERGGGVGMRANHLRAVVGRLMAPA
jgi:hypothetical protein